MHRAAEQVEHRDGALFWTNQGNRGLLIETENGFVREGNGGATALLDPNPVTGAVGLVQAHRLPLCLTRSLGFYAPLHRDYFGGPFLTRACHRSARTQGAYE